MQSRTFDTITEEDVRRTFRSMAGDLARAHGGTSPKIHIDDLADAIYSAFIWHGDLLRVFGKIKALLRSAGIVRGRRQWIDL